MQRRRKVTLVGLILAFSSGCSSAPSAQLPIVSEGIHQVDSRAGLRVQSLPSAQGAANTGLQNVITSVVHPRFDIKMPESQIDAILADEKEHAISVLFDDTLKIRVRKSQGEIRGKANDSGLVSLENRTSELSAINKTLSNQVLDSIAPAYNQDAVTENELEARKKDVEAKGGFYMPNRASFAKIKIANYSKVNAKNLIKALQATPGVLSAEPVPVITTAAITYRQPPSDPTFPTSSNWQAMDYCFTDHMIVYIPRRVAGLSRNTSLQSGAAWLT